MTDETQAVPAEDVADPYELANQLFGYSDESTPDYLAEFLEDNGRMATALADRLTASEAEATSLRRKLEEHRKALEPFARENDLPTNLPDSTRLTITFAGQQVAHATFGDFRRARALSEREGQE